MERSLVRRFVVVGTEGLFDIVKVEFTRYAQPR